MKATLLIELLTEELPPKALEKLSTTFANEVFAALKEQALLSENSVCTPFATPRRLALSITEVESAAGRPCHRTQRPGRRVPGWMPTGKPTKALEGFMRSANVTFPQLQRVGRRQGRILSSRASNRRASRWTSICRTSLIAGAEEAAGAEADALGRFGAPVRASGARPDHPARQARRDGGGAGADQRQRHQRPSLHVQRAGHDRQCGRLRSDPGARRARNREFRAAPRKHRGAPG